MAVVGKTASRVTTGVVVPEKLRDDAIIEAVCSLSFTTSEVAEVVVGRLSDAVGREYTPTRLPFADIPQAIRERDENLRAQPVLELRRKDGVRVVRLSERVISYHLVGVKNYCGWTAFRSELETVFSGLFSKLQGVKVTSIGFRYINAIVSQRHFISNVHDLNIETKVGGRQLTVPINLNFVEEGTAHATTTRVAHPRFVQGTLPQDTSAVVDVEVTTPKDFTALAIENVMKWVDDAHGYEKEAFFRLIPPDILRRLVEK